ncbi:MAG: PKD domain-containing protein, partial [Saprospiraceae bacterium]|nr:PKD domain-containing protein [Saprospiraceae bacterium]
FGTTNGTASVPSISFKGNNYNVTQFYAADLNPNANSNILLAGAQDNGTQMLNSSGLGAGISVNGGDGGYCHIDQNEPNIQIATYVYNDYTITNNSWSSSSNYVIGSSVGYFINPCEYDDANNVLYGSNNGGTYSVITSVGSGNVTTTKSVAAFGSNKVTAMKVSPITSNRVYFGLSNGAVYKVDNANGTPTATSLNGPGSSWLNCIEVENANENHILAVYSSYGVTSIYETTNGGSTWTSIEGNLPDMPIHWAVFNPSNSDQIVVGTELGVWSTDNINGTSTVWGTSNNGLANTRISMLKYRASDKLLIAATHGRGLFSSDVFTSATADFTLTPYVSYTNKTVQFNDFSYKATSWSWAFGDGQTSTLQNPTHTYATPGLYSVTLTINGGASTLTKTNVLQILPDLTVSYLVSNGGNFDQSSYSLHFGQYTAGGTIFERGSSTITGKSSTASGSYAWVTGLTSANYDNNTESYLYTPNFDLTSLNTYVLKFKSKFITESTWDGFRVEYSLNKGDTWTVLSPSVAPGWYNYSNPNTDRPFPQNQAYFTGSYGTAFNLYTKDISSLAGNANVAFRFVFKSDVSVTDVGIAIDDFEITSTVLPLELISFNGKIVNNKIPINWITNNEVNVKKFILEKSIDGSNFYEINTQLARGNYVNGQTMYQFTDETSKYQFHYYRLKMIENDGRFNFSNIIKIEQPNHNNVKIYPTLCSDFVTLSNESDNNNFELVVYDNTGRLLQNMKYIVEPQSQTIINLEDVNIENEGVYFIAIYAKGVVQKIEKIVKIQ